MSAIFVSGAASGLGQGFLRAYIQRIHDNPRAPFTKDTKIYALDRLFLADYIATLLPQYSSEWLEAHVLTIQCDVTDDEAVGKAISAHNIEKLGLVIHSVGVRGLVPEVPLSQYSDVAKAENLEVMTAATMRKTFEINAMGSFLLMRALLPALQRQAAENASVPPKVVVMGSRMGSIGHNTELGKAYAYRASKAALNAIIKSFSVDIPEVVWTIVHPGRVETGLVSIKEDDAMPVSQSVEDVLMLIDNYSAKDSGRFMDRLGKEIPW